MEAGDVAVFGEEHVAALATEVDARFGEREGVRERSFETSEGQSLGREKRFVTPASACWTLVGALAKGHEEDQLRGISVPA